RGPPGVRALPPAEAPRPKGSASRDLRSVEYSRLVLRRGQFEADALTKSGADSQKRDAHRPLALAESMGDLGGTEAFVIKSRQQSRACLGEIFDAAFQRGELKVAFVGLSGFGFDLVGAPVREDR